MSRRNPIDVMTTALLKLEKYLRQSFKRHFIFSLSFEGLTDLVVLTIDTSEIAQSKKDVSGAVAADESRLFAEVRRIRGNNRTQSGITRGNLVVQPVDVAIARADTATTKHFHEQTASLGQLSGFKELDVRRIGHTLDSTDCAMPRQTKL
ncbi:MAG TPA: hypothetical protein VN687_14440 [Blastocatellia bacterium]|nr:hypothetical protein [Blastocatellia bacterium]